MDPALVRLAQAYGVETGYWDWKHQYRSVAQPTIVACLAALGVDTAGDDWLGRAECDLDGRAWRAAVPPCTVVETGQTRRIDVHVGAGRPAQAHLELEDGTTLALEQVDNWQPDREIDGRWVGRASFTVPAVPMGYHRLVLTSDDQSWQAPYIVSPASLDLAQLHGQSVWGLMSQVYAVGAAAGWGMGDFVDLRDLGVWAKTSYGADCLLINPVHAAEVAPRLEPSPYLPATRRFFNPWYIRPEAIEEYATAGSEVRAEVGINRAVARSVVDAEPLIDRDAVWTAKLAGLRAICAVPRSRARQAGLDDYIRRGGAPLQRYATWCALTAVYGPHWTDWPPEFQDPGSDQVASFRDGAADQVEFYCWLQWIAEHQLRAAHQGCRDVGMAIGLMADLAVGVNRQGEETWASRELFADGVTVGAPPDDYNQGGQDWQQPPWRPDRLEQAGYEPFRQIIRAALSYAGAIRIDHIIGWFRLWWVPDGLGADQGTYVRYDYAAMVGILALEVARAGAIAIGEDLGTVDPMARDYLARRGILGTSVAWFEQDDQRRPRPPEDWRRLCVASVTTHDLPPTLGYLAHDHVRLRHELGLLTEPLADVMAADVRDQNQVRQLLIERGWLEANQTDPVAVMRALYRWLAATPARIKLVALTDAVGQTATQNQPGTADEYPNWRVPLADRAGRRLTLEDVYDLESVGQLTELMAPAAHDQVD